ncbi:lipase/serine esteras-like protein [Periconia macrospinosa]|uniref:Lipase/serine esteras-like protein n=1 Tax=Periconia macrospinosa TaxID=97972 RepID=A0A2V1E591_9PLEO|nr:lipase/serine esteras-like protein [Periconia macrospinosa]
MTAKPDHLCVLVHGLWGNPSHLKFLADSLRERHPEDKLHILVVKRNAGSFTYDGIETGGERVANEVEESIADLESNGHEIKKLSVVGYSLGGLISRYAIGLLYSKGLFERIEPVNFVTFATPHLGVRSPLRGYHNHVWNVLGARTLSFSGRQLFMIDEFRDTGKPLLSVLAAADSIFIRALSKFRRRSVYANVINDRTVAYYTAAFSQTDPYVDVNAININYVEGYGDVVVDNNKPPTLKELEPALSFPRRLQSSARSALDQAPLIAFMFLFIPVGSTLFLLNSAVQSVRSGQRLRLHEDGKAGADFRTYRVPLFNAMRKEVEDMFENMNNTQQQEYLAAGDEDIASPTQPISPRTRKPSFVTRKSSQSKSDVEKADKQEPSQFPALALTPEQFKMIENLDNVGFQKFPVFIHKHRHTHAAIIRRMNRKSFEEGYIIVRHWLDNFQL